MNSFNKNPEDFDNYQEHAKMETFIDFNIVKPDIFLERISLLPKPLFAFLTPYNEDDYIRMQTKLFLSTDSESGFGLNPDGQLVSVFSLKRERGVLLVKKAREEGAGHLSCMGEKLVELYSSFGFRVIKQEEWNDKYAPNHWDYERFGKPNVYEMGL